MPRLQQPMKPAGEFREVLFWLLLLGSWQFLVVPGTRNTACGLAGTSAFLVFAYRNLGRLRGLGLAYAAWRPANRHGWLAAVVSGLVAGAIVSVIGSSSGSGAVLNEDWRLAVLQVTLGPVLEEVLFRGYLFAVLVWALKSVAEDPMRDRLVVMASATVFALAHCAQPGVSWLELACITSTGMLYGWLRHASGSTAPAAASHAVYNLTLYAAGTLVAMTQAGGAIAR